MKYVGTKLNCVLNVIKTISVTNARIEPICIITFVLVFQDTIMMYKLMNVFLHAK